MGLRREDVCVGVQTCAPSSACDFIVYGFRLSTGVFLGFFFRRLCRILSHHFLECGQIVGHHCVMNPERLFGLPFPHSTPSPHVHFKTFLHPNPFVPVETSPSELLFCSVPLSFVWILRVRFGSSLYRYYPLVFLVLHICGQSLQSLSSLSKPALNAAMCCLWLAVYFGLRSTSGL